MKTGTITTQGIEAEDGTIYPLSETAKYYQGFNLKIGKKVNFQIEKVTYLDLDLAIEYAVPLPSVKRLEIIGKNGRELVIKQDKIDLSFQDGGRTLKIFIL
jgi:hypothetical protein